MLAVVALVASVASAELLKNFKYDGKVEVNAYQTNNANDFNSKVKDKDSDVETRVQLNTGFDLNEDVNAVVSAIKCNRQYGDQATGNGESIDNLTNQIKFNQAYMNLKGVLGIDHKLGRQYYGNEGDLVVYYGPNMYPYTAGLSVNSLDAWTGWYKTGKWDMHAVSGKLANTNNGVAADTDVNLNGFVAAYDLMTDLKLGAYIYEKKSWQAAAATDLTLDVVGVKANGKFVGFDYYAELAKNYGRNAVGPVNYAGTAFLANAKYGYDFMGKWTFMGEFAMGSGDNKTTDKKNKAFHSINSDYRPGAIMGRSMSGLGNSDPTAAVTDTGLTTWNVGAKWNPSKVEKLDLCAKYFYFAPTETKKDAVKIGYTSVGTELDFAANWKHSENVNVRATVAAFMPNKKYAAASALATTKHDAVNYAGLDFIVKF
jgi:hypothetical protein